VIAGVAWRCTTDRADCTLVPVCSSAFCASSNTHSIPPPLNPRSISPSCRLCISRPTRSVNSKAALCTGGLRASRKVNSGLMLTVKILIVLGVLLSGKQLTRIGFGGYLILLVPARSAPAHEHHLHRNPTIFGSNCLSNSTMLSIQLSPQSSQPSVHL
jgi:hypothetical protein